MSVPANLSPQDEQRLIEKAKELNVRPEDLVAAAVKDLLDAEADDFRSAADRVLSKNRELYKRLS